MFFKFKISVRSPIDNPKNQTKIMKLEILKTKTPISLNISFLNKTNDKREQDKDNIKIKTPLNITFLKNKLTERLQ